MDQVWILLFIGVIITISLLFYFSPSYAKKIVSTATGPFSLNPADGTPNPIIDSPTSAAFYKESNGTFSAFVYLNPMNRTGAQAPCGKPGQASCADGTYAPCPCDAATSDCSVCAHTGYSSVFNISGVAGLEALIAPDASRQGNAMAQVTVQTQGPAVNSAAGKSGASQKYIETLPLPTIPLQKWVLVTIAREGRRFDIYYNDAIVLSKKTAYMPISNMASSSLNGVTSGSPGLIGQLAVVNLYNYRLSTADVAAKYVEYADSRGTPYLNTGTTLSDVAGVTPSFASALSYNVMSYIPSFNLCPKGGCFTPPTIRPASPLYDWTTSY